MLSSGMVWVMVLMLSGSGKDIVVPDVYYLSQEECVEAARDAGRGMPDWVCIRGRR